MKIKLLNDGGYGDMEKVKFPVEVEAVPYPDSGFEVLGSEIMRVGGTDYWAEDNYYFWLNKEVEVVK